MTTMGKHSPPINGTLMPFTIPPPMQQRGPVSALPQPAKVERRRPDGTAFIVVALFAVAQVAVVAFSGSWQHQYELSVHLGQAHWVAGMQPLSVEGLIASATLVIWYAARYKHGIPAGAYLVLAAGVGQTVLMNLGADYRWGWLGPEISVWPAVAFVAAYEMAVWLVRKRQGDSGGGNLHVERPARLAGGKTYCACGRPWPCPYAEPPDVPVVTPHHDSVPKPPSRKRPPVLSGRDRAAAIMKAEPGLTNAAVAKRAGVDVRTVQRARNSKTGSKP